MKTFIVSLIIAVAITALFITRKEKFSWNNQQAKNNQAMKYCTEVKVKGRSMEPLLKQGVRVCAYQEKPAVGDLAVFKCKDCPIKNEAVKKVEKIENDCFWLLGEDPSHSLDSRQFGFLCPENLEYIWKAEEVED